MTLYKKLKVLLLTSLTCIVVVLNTYVIKAQNSVKDTAQINHLLAAAYDNIYSDTTSAMRDAHQALILSQKINDSLLIFDSQLCLADIYSYHNKHTKANAHYLKALEFEAILHDSMRNEVNYCVANSYIACGNYDKAFEYIQKLYRLSQASHDKYAEQWSYSVWGSFYLEINEYEKASEYYMKSIDLAVANNDIGEICASYRRLTKVYVKAKNYDLALQCAEKLNGFLSMTNDPLDKATILINNARTLKDCKKYEEANAWYLKVEDIYKSLKFSTHLEKLYSELTENCIAMGDLSKAEYYASLCSTNNPDMSDFDLMEHQGILGKLYLKKNQYQKAISFYQKSIEIAEQYQKKDILLYHYADISEAYERINNSMMSLSYLKKSKSLQDSLFSQEQSRHFAEAQFKYNVHKSEAQIKAAQVRNIYILVSCIAIILIIVLISFYNFSKVKNEKNKILEEKNQAINDKNRQLYESNAILRRFAYHDLKEPLRRINMFVNIIQKRYLTDIPAEAQEYMTFIYSGVRRIDNLVNSLQEYSTILNDDSTLDEENDLTTILKEIIYQHDDMIQAKNITIKKAKQFPKILMNEANIKQLITNLFHNAVKFNKENASIDIGFNIIDNEMILYITDQGNGIDKTTGDNIFKHFLKIDRNTNYDSVGMGLTVCKNIMDKYKGRIWFKSVQSEGTTFFVAFPLEMVSHHKQGAMAY